MQNDELLKWIALWLPELNSVQIGKLRDKFMEVEREARIGQVKRIQRGSRVLDKNGIMAFLELDLHQIVTTNPNNPEDGRDYSPDEMWPDKEMA